MSRGCEVRVRGACVWEGRGESKGAALKEVGGRGEEVGGEGRGGGGGGRGGGGGKTCHHIEVILLLSE